MAVQYIQGEMTADGQVAVTGLGTPASGGHTYALLSAEFNADQLDVLAPLIAAGQLPATGTAPVIIEGFGGGMGGGGGGTGGGGSDGDGADGGASALYQSVSVVVNLAVALDVHIGAGGAGNVTDGTATRTPPLAGTPSRVVQGTNVLAAFGAATLTANGAAGGAGSSGSSGAGGGGGASPAYGSQGDSFLGPGGPSFVWLGGAGGAAGAAGAGGGGGGAGARGSSSGGATGGKGGDGSAVGAPGGAGTDATANTGGGGGGGGGGSNTGTTAGGTGGAGGSGWLKLTVLVQTS